MFPNDSHLALPVCFVHFLFIYLFIFGVRGSSLSRYTPLPTHSPRGSSLPPCVVFFLPGFPVCSDTALSNRKNFFYTISIVTPLPMCCNLQASQFVVTLHFALKRRQLHNEILISLFHAIVSTLHVNNSQHYSYTSSFFVRNTSLSHFHPLFTPILWRSVGYPWGIYVGGGLL